DGSEWCQGFLDYHRPDAVRVLDFPHALEHVATAARASFADTAACAGWLAERAADLKERDPALALEALRALPVEGAPDPAAAAEARDATRGGRSAQPPRPPPSRHPPTRRRHRPRPPRPPRARSSSSTAARPRTTPGSATPPAPHPEPTLTEPLLRNPESHPSRGAAGR